MKTLTLFALLIGMVSFAQAQQGVLIKADPRLYEIFESDQVQKMEENNPNLILHYNLYLTQSYTITQLPYKQESIDLYPSLPIPDSLEADKINILLYEFDLNPKTATLFRWGKTDKLLKFIPLEEFNIRYDAARKEAGLL
jgi:hypothetical protein